jgi:hypothetical protein
VSIFPFVAEVAFVEDDQRLYFLTLCGNQCAGDEFIGKGWLGGNDDDELIDVGSDQLLADFVGTIEQAAPRLDRFDNALIIRGLLDIDPVATGDLAFFAAGKTGESRSVGKFNDVLAAMGSDDATFHCSVLEMWVRVWRNRCVDIQDRVGCIHMPKGFPHAGLSSSCRRAMRWAAGG